ncbi:4Fe-4S binding protein [Carboxylicivirga caseinilyticus]|uniref:4Fe-4S binding protein n=1 Tax=Carboxylicivirga caseinilyticus TaxID=3417572 RepID=UPI003D326DC2|nr:4Fe-4S binding protein [Marinilabiliaceae bacterium A049]
MENKSFNRREFLLKLGKAGVLLTLPPLLKACSESMYGDYFVNVSLCTGCEECLDVCYYNAINITGAINYSIDELECISCTLCSNACPESAVKVTPAVFTINADNCNECNMCSEVCTYNATLIAVKTYSINDDNCTDCGNCLEVCDQNAISLNASNITYKPEFDIREFLKQS